MTDLPWCLVACYLPLVHLKDAQVPLSVIKLFGRDFVIKSHVDFLAFHPNQPWLFLGFL